MYSQVVQGPLVGILATSLILVMWEKHFPITGSIYNNMGLAGKTTSIVLTFPSLEISAEVES